MKMLGETIFCFDDVFINVKSINNKQANYLSSPISEYSTEKVPHTFYKVIHASHSSSHILNIPLSCSRTYLYSLAIDASLILPTISFRILRRVSFSCDKEIVTILKDEATLNDTT